MIRVKMKTYICLFLLLMGVIQVGAQTRVLPILESPTSPKSLSLGSSKMGNINSSFIYTNPAALFNSSRLHADYSFGWMPTDGNTYQFHTLTTGYQTKKSGFMIGGRYLSMGSFDNWLNSNMENVGQGKVRFYSYTLDLGYAYKLNRAFSFYSTLGYAKEKTIFSMSAYYLGVGSYYSGNNLLFNKNIAYSIGLSATNLGKYTYRGNSEFLSPNIRLGGSMLIPTFSNQSLELFLDGGVYLPVSDNKWASSFSGGMDYSFLKKYSLRVGGHCGEQDDFLSAGVGVKLGVFDFIVGSKIALRSDLDNIYMVGLKVEL